MYPIHNRGGELIAYLHQNAILHPDTFSVMGVMIGNCVFGPEAKVLGKSFHHKVYAISGELLGVVNYSPLPVPQQLNATSWMKQAWQILTRVKDHVCPWIPEKDVWSEYSLFEHLNAN